MKQIECTVKDIPKEIKYSCLFEFRINSDDTRFSECISHVAFGNNENMIYVSLISFDNDYNMIDHIIQENFDNGINISLAERDGSIVAAFKFDKCNIKDIAPIILDYCGNYKTPHNRYIVSIEYDKVYKLISDEI